MLKQYHQLCRWFFVECSGEWRNSFRKSKNKIQKLKRSQPALHTFQLLPGAYLLILFWSR